MTFLNMVKDDFNLEADINRCWDNHQNAMSKKRIEIIETAVDCVYAF